MLVASASFEHLLCVLATSGLTSRDEILTLAQLLLKATAAVVVAKHKQNAATNRDPADQQLDESTFSSERFRFCKRLATTAAAVASNESCASVKISSRDVKPEVASTHIKCSNEAFATSK